MSEHVTRSEGETAALGRDLGRRLSAGDVVLLTGPLGGGKTAFVRGLAEGLGCDPDNVSSPTFAIIQEYRGKVPLQHVDLYRLTPAEVDDLGLDDLMASSVMAVEWPECWHGTLDAAWRVAFAFEPTGEGVRRITIANPS